MDINALNSTIQGFREQLKRAAEQAPSSVFGDISAMWDVFLSSRHDFSLNDILVFLRKDIKRIVGTGNVIAGQQEFDLQLKRYSDWVPADYVAQIKQSTFGCPEFFKYGEGLTSISHMSYVSMFKTVEDLHNKHNLPFKSLAVCEVGAGWAGLANIMMGSGCHRHLLGY